MIEPFVVPFLPLNIMMAAYAFFINQSFQHSNNLFITPSDAPTDYHNDI